MKGICFLIRNPPSLTGWSIQCKGHKLTITTKKGYLMDMQLIQTIVITAVSVFMVVQLLNNLVPRWKEYVGLEGRRD